MPTSGTHITVVQRLALDPQMKPLLGNPDTDPAVEDKNSSKYDPAGLIRMKYANLGAVGPDLFYAMLDYGPELQDYQNFLIKVGGSFQCMSELMEETSRYIDGTLNVITSGIADSLSQTTGLLTGIINQSILGMIVRAGFNFWPTFQSRRQVDQPREKWFWADYLHYVRTGQFARELLKRTKEKLDKEPANTQHQNLYAYALGYLTHYIVDVVGHPYVNQVVQAPYRLYWQRHHLVENFIDAYVWDRWHNNRPTFPAPTTKEQPLDAIKSTPNPMGVGAPFTFSRLHDHIAVGQATLGDPVDDLVTRVCDKIKQGLFDMGVAEDIESPEPSDADFQAWTELMADTIKSVYDANSRHPRNLAGRVITGEPPSEGHPFAKDIGAAYGTLRLVLKLTTEEKIKEPNPPKIMTDISADVQKLMTVLQSNLTSLPAPQLAPPSTTSKLDLNELMKAIKNAAIRLSEVAEKVAETVFDFVKDMIQAGVTAVTDSIKYALYVLNKSLFALYRAVRDVLVLAADATPFTQDLTVNRGGLFDNRTLWGSTGDLGINMYPVEEFVIPVGFTGRYIAPQRNYLSVPAYAPFIPPTLLGTLSGGLGAGVEQPAVNLTAPYRPAPGAQLTTPDDFIDGARGPDDMFASSGPQIPMFSSDPRAPSTFAAQPRNFGGAVANCAWAIQHWADPGFVLPDYNLDGDRGYAWPCWDVEPMVPPPPNSTPVSCSDKVPLDPTDRCNAGIAHANVGKAN